MKQILSLFYLLVLFSCNNQNKNLEKKIVGEWVFSKEIDLKKKADNYPPPFEFYERFLEGYTFYNNDSCDYKNGFFKSVYDSINIHNSLFKYLGTKTEFKIEGDSLKFFHLSKNYWISSKLISLINDTLTIEVNDSVFYIYQRKKFNLNKNETYDKIIVSSSGCYGSCPISDICISKTGDVIYYGKEYNFYNGLYKSSISKTDYLIIENSFKKANIKELKTNYSATHTDDENITVSFIKNNKIIKTISDYGHSSPKEFIWAYTPVRYLSQKLKLDTFITNNLISSYSWILFEGKTQEFELSKSELFYLFTELSNSKMEDKKFDKHWKLKILIDNNIESIIYTDGKYYLFNGKFFNLGYNFFEKNDLYKRIRKKEKFHLN